VNLPLAFRTSIFGLALLASARAAGAGAERAPTDLSPQEIIANVEAQNPDMRTFQAHVHVAFHLTSFPYLGQSLDGTTYFKRPNNYEVVFQKVPPYAKGFDKLYSDIGDPSDWDQRFAMTVVGKRELRGHTDVVLRLVQKVRGMIDHEDVAVDPNGWHIENMDWYYYNGGHIAMSQDFATVGSFSVIAAQHATIRIPFVHAALDGAYDDYKTNVAIDDTVFTKDEKK
jgi:hypothetical protein